MLVPGCTVKLQQWFAEHLPEVRTEVIRPKESWQDAAAEAVAEAYQSLRHIKGVDVIKQTAHVEGGKITEYRTTLNVAFVVEHHSQIIGTGEMAVGR